MRLSCEARLSWLYNGGRKAQVGFCDPYLCLHEEKMKTIYKSGTSKQLSEEVGVFGNVLL